LHRHRPGPHVQHGLHQSEREHARPGARHRRAGGRAGSRRDGERLSRAGAQPGRQHRHVQAAAARRDAAAGRRELQAAEAEGAQGSDGARQAHRRRDAACNPAEMVGTPQARGLPVAALHEEAVRPDRPRDEADAEARPLVRRAQRPDRRDGRRRPHRVGVDCGAAPVGVPSAPACGSPNRREDRMSSTATGVAPITSVVIAPDTEAAALYTSARIAGSAPEPDLNLRRYPGRLIEHLTFTNVYLGGASHWSPDDIEHIDFALPAAMSDLHLNNVLAQYFPDGNPTSTFRPSRVLEGPLPARVYRDTIEHLVDATDVSGFDLATTVFCYFLPRGTVLVDGTSNEHGSPPDSEHGLGGYHGSVHAKTGTVYYAVGAVSEGTN